MTPTDVHEGTAARDHAVTEGQRSADAGDHGDDRETDGAKHLPSLEDVEDLILEAYNNMQSDGEHIFLPDDVASKLHYVAQLVKSAGYTSDDAASHGSESNQEEPNEVLLRSAASSAPASPLIHEPMRDELHAPTLHLDDNNAAEISDEDAKREEQASVEVRAGESDGADSAELMKAEDAAALSPVEELSDESLSIDDLHLETEAAQDTLSPSPQKSSPPSSERTRRAVDPPVSRLRKPEIQRRKSSVSAPLRSHSKVPSPIKSAPTPRSTLASSRLKPDVTPPASRERSPSSYEQRREAAQKIKEEKALRELHVRESARKQREDARRKLEEVQQKELAAKRERVARLKMQKDRKTSVAPAKPSTVR